MKNWLYTSAASIVAILTNLLSAADPQFQALGQQSVYCKPIGLVLSSGDRRFKLGNTLCQGDRVNTLPGGKVSVFCIANGRTLKLSGLSLDFTRMCTTGESRIQQRFCNVQNTINCPKTKGPGEENRPVLISPYSRILLDRRPTLTWNTVEGAISYTVGVSGEDVNWVVESPSATLPYPTARPAMSPGNTYRITIFANKGGSSVSYSEATIYLLPLEDIEQITKTAKLIQSLNLPTVEKHLYLDSLYMGKSLLDETMRSLEEGVRLSGQDPQLFRTLGDRYLEAGLPLRAKLQYEKASQLAQSNEDPIELEKARTGLELITHYNQLPTRINPAQ